MGKNKYVQPEFRLTLDNDTVRAYEIIVKKAGGKESIREHIELDITHIQ